MRTIETAVQDIRVGVRLIWRSPGFSLVGITSLAVGLGAGLALFSFMNALLFRPLPGRRTADLQQIFTSNGDGSPYGSTSFADFQSFSSAQGTFSAICATTPALANLTASGQPQAVPGAIMSGGCFGAIGVHAHLGRLLQPADDIPTSAAPPIVISYALWLRAFGGNSGIAGQTVHLDGTPVVIVGVTERGFAGLSLDRGAAFFAPAQMAPRLLSPASLADRRDRRFRVYGRLAPGLVRSIAVDRLSQVAAELRAADPRAWIQTDGSTRTVTVIPEVEGRFATGGGKAAIALATLAAIAGLAAMACVNLATMLLAKGASRTRELNIRLSLGASHARILRQLATESLLVSLGGVVAGALVLVVALGAFETYRPPDIPAFNVGLDWRVGAFALAMALAAPMAFGLAPAAHALRLAIAEGLKGRPALIRRRYLNVGARELLIVTQVALSFALLVAAALFTRSLAASAPGALDATAARVTIVPIDLNTAARSNDEARAAPARLLASAARVEGVAGATAAAIVPMTGTHVGYSGRADDRPEDPLLTLDTNIVAPGYFDIAGIALRHGRDFSGSDHDSSPRVAVVSESLARQLWKTAAVVGRAVRLSDGPREIVGVVGDVPYRSFYASSHPVIYLPLTQAARTRFLLHVRSRNQREALASLDRSLRAVDPRILIGPATTLRRFMDDARVEGRLARLIGSVAGVLQLGLALMATWGLVSYAVERRTAEIAVRRALGATESSIVQLVLRPSLWLVALGGVMGCGSGVVAAKALHAEFTGLAPIDLTVVAPAAALLAVVVVIAAWLPARRAVAIEPASALKQA